MAGTDPHRIANRPTAPGRPLLATALPVVLSAALLAALTVGAARIADPPRAPDLLDRLSPTSPGTIWVYRVTNFGKPSGTHVVQATGRAVLGQTGPAMMTSSHYDDFLGNGALDSVSYSGRRGDRVLDFGVRRSGSFDRRDPPTPTLVAPLRPGQRWSWSGAAGSVQERIETSVAGYEAVRVAGRVMTECLHLSSRIVDRGSPPETSEAWDCPGIGTVRSRQSAPAGGGFPGALLEEELVEFHGPELDLPTAVPAAGAGSIHQPMGGGPGVDGGRTDFVAGASLDAHHLAWSDARLTHLHLPPVGANGVSVTAEEDGTTSALDTESGEILWSLQVAAPVPVSPVLAGSAVLVASADRELMALDLRTGRTRWMAKLPDMVSAAPLPAGDRVVVVTEDRAVRALRLSDGGILWSGRTGELVENHPALWRGMAIVGDRGGAVAALSLKDGHQRWETSLDGALTAGPAVRDGLVVVADHAETVTGLDASTGDVRWRTYPDSSVTVSPALAPGRVVFVAADTERLVSVDPASGTVQWRARLNVSVSVPPLVLGDRVLVLTSTGLLRIFGLEDGREDPPIRIHGPEGARGITCNIPMNWMDGNLVVVADASSPWPVPGYIQAFPAPPSGGRGPADGVRLQGHLQVLPGLGTLTAPPASVEGALVVALKDNARSLRAVYRVDSAGSSELVQSDRLIPFTVRDGDRILTQQGEDLISVPVAGGPPVWRFHLGPPTIGSSPVVVGGVAVIPVPGQGLVGLDAATGLRLWSVAAAGPGTSSPLVLPGGDVAYGVGRLLRLDPRTGDVRWSVPGVSTFAPLAYGNGTIVELGFLQGQAIVLAVRAASGQIAWAAQDVRVGVSGGPAIGDGVAVVADGIGRVVAFDLGSGARVWSMRLRSSPVGPAVIRGGRVAVLESGRTEDLGDRDYRLTILDARSGRFLASHQPGGAGGFALIGSFAMLDGRFLLPAPGLGRGTLQVMEMRGP